MNPLPATSLFQSHPRSYETNRFVYPVLSRRAGGMSIGVNLNPEKYCNFDCVYCQVDRRERGGRALSRKDLPQLEAELEQMVELVVSGQIFAGPKFSTAPPELRRLNDIAMSGDGEPTASALFPEAVDLCAAIRRRRQLDDVKIVLITNATLLNRPKVQAALAVLDANNGEIWGKLDAGTEAYYQQIDRTRVSLAEVMGNLTETARTRPIVIQSLFMRLHDVPPTAEEQAAYCDRLRDIMAAGGQIKLVQIHTIARQPAETWVTPLSNAEVDALAALVRERTALPVQGYYGYSA